MSSLFELSNEFQELYSLMTDPDADEELKDALEYAIKQEKPVAIRYPKNQNET